MDPLDVAASTAPIPEDVLAEQDLEARRMLAQPVLDAPHDMVPEDVRGERDLEARQAAERVRQSLAEGAPVIEDSLEGDVDGL